MAEEARELNLIGLWLLRDSQTFS